jgi:DprA winged helix domain
VPKRVSPRPQLNAAAVTERLARRGQVMAAFTSRPGAALDFDQVLQATGLPVRQCRAILTGLEEDGWLRRAGPNDLGHLVWQRTTDTAAAGDSNGSGGQAQPAAAPGPDVAPPPRRSGPGDDYWCKHCHRAATTDGMPPPGWYRLQEAHLATGRAWFTTGLFCSLPCVAGNAKAGR